MLIRIELALGTLELYGIVFLLGSFSVAALSDLRRMSAQVEFTEIWALVAVLFFVLDCYIIFITGSLQILWKWLLVLLFMILSNARFGILFRVATGDLLACAAMLMLLPVFVGVLFIIILKVLDLILRPLLRKAGSGGAYPFIPVVLVASLGLFAIELLYLQNVSFDILLPF